ncbi:hypothetical protein MVEN_01979900 [Mycena venus]|uniref:Uncharacterized protein n=1 Tax=Mycena venus TaxID=2733690 RepID=A0A8H6XEG1_9AGAR|nr:hypothetical protein MVEN_01979900 [Mycena venus]
MTPTSALVTFILLAGAASLHVPPCLPDEDATILSQPMFPVVDPSSLQTINLTLTYFTCPSRQVQPQNANTMKRQSQTPVDLCTLMEGGQVQEGSIFSCEQAPGEEPTNIDCSNIDDTVIDNLVRGMTIIVPPLSGVIVTIQNNTCALTFSNNDLTVTLETCLEAISDMYSNIALGGCHIIPPAPDGFIGSIRSIHSPGNSFLQNWQLNILSFSSLDL